LRRGRAAVAAALRAQEHVLELHHAGVDKEQRGVGARYQRRAGRPLVPPFLKERQECFPYLVAGHHVFSTPHGSPRLACSERW